MKKNRTFGFAALGIVFLLVSVIAFAIPTKKTAAFWIAYGFTIAAIASQIIIWKSAFGRKDSLKSKFLGIPIVHIGFAYLVIQVLAFAVFAAIPSPPVWSAIVVCALILGASALCMISAETGRGEIERVEAKVQKKVFYIKNLQADVETLAEAETDSEIKSALQQLAEKIRFSDPMSDEVLAEVEETITEKVADLQNASDKMAVIRELNSLLAERNKKCRMLK